MRVSFRKARSHFFLYVTQYVMKLRLRCTREKFPDDSDDNDCEMEK